LKKSPQVGGNPANVFIDAGQQIALEHVYWSQLQATVVHRLEDRVGVVVAVSGDLNDLNAVLQPIDEVRQRITLELLR
jgi:hypothetical protein